MKLVYLNIKIIQIVVFLGLNFCLTQAILSQTTNCIPPYVFLTDNGFLFSYKPSGERVVNLRKIEEGKRLRECRPAEEDPDGHWGQATNGFQLSLRFGKMTFTNGEPIVATMLIRNVAQKPLNYLRPAYIIASKDGTVLKGKNETGLIEITALPMATLFPQTQCRYLENLNKNYDLSKNGNYTFQAKCPNSAIISQPVVITITNGVE